MALTKDEILEKGYNKLTLEDMVEYIRATEPDYEESFACDCFDLRYPRISKPVYNADGTPKMKRYHKVIKGVKQDTWSYKQVEVMVEDTTAEKEEYFNLLKAKNAFCGHFKDFEGMLPSKKEKKDKTEKLSAGLLELKKKKEAEEK